MNLEFLWVAILASSAIGLVIAPRPNSATVRASSASSTSSASITPAEAEGGLLRYRAILSLLAGLAAALIVGGELGLIAGSLAAAGTWQALGRMEPPADRIRRERLAAGLPHVVDLMASSLAAGSSPVTAVELAAYAVESPLREELLLVTSRLQLGVDPVRVWSDVGRHAQLGALGRCLARATDSGAPVSEAIHRLGEDLRRDARAAVESKARAVGVKAAAPLGLCLLPAFILTGIVPLVVGSLGTVLHF